MKVISHSRRFRRGQAIVEFALVVPVLIAMMIGIAEMAWVAKNSVTISNAAREGSRAAAVGRKSSSVTSRVTAYATGLAPTVTLSQYNESTGTWGNWPTETNADTYNKVTTGTLVRVSVEITHQQLTGFFPFLNNLKLKQEAIMRKEATAS